MLSGFGFGNLQNILYGILYFAISVGLFLYKYGVDTLVEHGIYAGAAALLVVYFLTGQIWYSLFQKKHNK